MATTVNYQSNSLTLYTWAQAAFAWDDPGYGHKTWQGAGVRVATMSIGETASVSDQNACGKEVVLDKREQVSITDGGEIVRTFTMNLLEALNVSESYLDQIGFILNFNESFSLSSAIAHDCTKSIAETLGVADHIAKQMDVSIAEAVSLVENFGRLTAFNLKFSEGVGITSALTKAVTLSKKEAIQVFEQYLKRADAVISDMIFSTTDLTLAAFSEVVDNGRSPGYAPFRDFIQGDYTYEKALFRAVLESSTDDRGRLEQFKVSVDMPDVFDRGNAVVTVAAAGVAVLFARPFQVAPEMTFQLKTGTVVAVPKALPGSITKTGFTGILVDPATGQQVTGSFTWTAHAY